MADHLLELADELHSGRYAPQPYTHFYIHEPKRRRISAAAFRDRVVHHALCQVIEPRFERVFLPDSYANRVGKGTHRAVQRLRHLAAGHRWVLRADIRQHFASIDHAVLQDALRPHVPEADVMQLIAVILAGGEGTRRLTAQYDAWRSGTISFAQFDASVQGWINHVRYADSWGLRAHVLAPFLWAPGCRRAPAGRRR